jgi:ferredoxin-type protein NapH
MSTPRQVRHFQMPDSLMGKLRVWRYILLRRIVQAGVLVLLYGSIHWGWQLFNAPILRGNLSASELLGVVPLADPFAALQILATGHMLETTVLSGALIVVIFYGLLGGRVFCSWVCPINPVTDLASWLRVRLGLRPFQQVSRKMRFWVLGLALLLSTASGVAAFEWISPISMLHRGILFGLGTGWVAVGAIFLLDLLILRHGWCGHLCPLGAFYNLLGKFALLRVRFDAETCTHCGDCAPVCPEPQVLNLNKAAEIGMISSGACSNCGRCIPVCPEDSLGFGLRKVFPRSST